MYTSIYQYLVYNVNDTHRKQCLLPPGKVNQVKLKAPFSEESNVQKEGGAPSSNSAKIQGSQPHLRSYDVSNWVSFDIITAKFEKVTP